MAIYNTTKCPVCGSTDASRVCHSSSHWGSMYPELQFCEDCGCVYVNEGVRELAKENRRKLERRKRNEAKKAAAIREILDRAIQEG